ncbi:MAG: glycosyltransferase [Verrucomicrobiales bacterium]
MDRNAISSPKWEELDGEYGDIFDDEELERTVSNSTLAVRCRTAELIGGEVADAYHAFQSGDRRRFLEMMAGADGAKILMLAFPELLPYGAWAEQLAENSVICCCNNPIPALFSGVPYCAYGIGGDYQTDCGRGDGFGVAMSLAFRRAYRIFAFNPHIAGHCRRLGFSNAVFLPYPIEDSVYCPGEGKYTALWKEEVGGEVFALCTARIDFGVKGNGRTLISELREVSRRVPNARFVFMRWGGDVERFEQELSDAGIRDLCLLLTPVGKRRLIDYYRSADLLIDQLVYGYYGSTALEAGCIGLPVVLKFRECQYRVFYGEEPPPFIGIEPGEDLVSEVARLLNDEKSRREEGNELRDWIERRHGERASTQIMEAFFRLAVEGVTIPFEDENPLREALTDEERSYHQEKAGDQ